MSVDPVKAKIRAELIRWLWDIEPGKTWTEAEVDSDQMEEFEQRVKTWACEEFVGAHEPERDQCGIPEHEYCFWCRKHMPNSWRPPAAEQPEGSDIEEEAAVGLDVSSDGSTSMVIARVDADGHVQLLPTGVMTEVTYELHPASTHVDAALQPDPDEPLLRPVTCLHYPEPHEEADECVNPIPCGRLNDSDIEPRHPWRDLADRLLGPLDRPWWRPRWWR